jgi:hypothetical protein
MYRPKAVPDGSTPAWKQALGEKFVNPNAIFSRDWLNYFRSCHRRISCAGNPGASRGRERFPPDW